MASSRCHRPVLRHGHPASRHEKTSSNAHSSMTILLADLNGFIRSGPRAFPTLAEFSPGEQSSRRRPLAQWGSEGFPSESRLAAWLARGKASPARACPFRAEKAPTGNHRHDGNTSTHRSEIRWKYIDIKIYWICWFLFSNNSELFVRNQDQFDLSSFHFKPEYSSPFGTWQTEDLSRSGPWTAADRGRARRSLSSELRA